jgi:hypothetical protein
MPSDEMEITSAMVMIVFVFLKIVAECIFP